MRDKSASLTQLTNHKSELHWFDSDTTLTNIAEKCYVNKMKNIVCINSFLW